jgi:hypothetical protein
MPRTLVITAEASKIYPDSTALHGSPRLDYRALPGNFHPVQRLLHPAGRLLHPSRFFHGINVLAALLVLLLGVLGVSPVLHDFCHAAGANHDTDCDHHCVVTDFAAGEAWFTPPPLLTAPTRTLVNIQPAAPARPMLEPETHRLQPACGPPV